MMRALRGRGELHVGDGDAADTAGDDLDRHFFGGELVQRIAQRLGAALHVGLEQDRNAADLLLFHLREHVLHLRGLLRELDVAELALAIQRDFARLAFVLDREDFIAGIRRALQAQHLHGHRRRGAFHRLAVLVEHGAHAAELVARDDRIAELQRALLDQHRGHGAAALLDGRFDDEAGGEAVGRRRELEHFGLQQDGVEQLVDALAGLGRHLHEHVAAAPFFGDDFVLGELGAHAIRIRVALVDLVDRHDDGHASRLGVLNGFDGLRHDAVVGRDHQHHHVGGLGAARTHGGERRVAGRVEEGDHALRRFDVIRADVLRDAARLTGRDLGAADVVEQRSLAVVDVTHDGDHGRTRLSRSPGALSPCRSSSTWSPLSTLATWPISSTTRVAVSRSMGWLMVAITPMFIMRLDDFGGLDGHLLRDFLRRDGLADGHFALHRRGGHFEGVLRLGPRHRCRCAP